MRGATVSPLSAASVSVTGEAEPLRLSLSLFVWVFGYICLIFRDRHKQALTALRQASLLPATALTGDGCDDSDGTGCDTAVTGSCAPLQLPASRRAPLNFCASLESLETARAPSRTRGTAR